MIRKFSINFGRKYSPAKICLFSIFHILEQSRAIIIIIYSKPYSLQILVLCTAVWCSCIYHFLKTINLIHLNISLEMGKGSPSLHNYTWENYLRRKRHAGIYWKSYTMNTDEFCKKWVFSVEKIDFEKFISNLYSRVIPRHKLLAKLPNREAQYEHEMTQLQGELVAVTLFSEKNRLKFSRQPCIENSY